MKDEVTISSSWDDLRPQLADGVSVDPPLNTDAPWVIAAFSVPRARVSADFARLAALFDGRRTVQEAVAEAGVEVDSAQAIAVVEALANAGLLRDGSASHKTPKDTGKGRRTGIRPARFAFRPPMTFQWAIFNPTSFARALARPLQQPIVRAAILIAAAMLIALAIISATINAESTLAALSTPLPIAVLGYLIIAVILTGCIHELSHAVTLAALGGRPTRMGIMLFYFMPAFFCDVTDGWRIGGRWRRAVIALAGPALHLVLAAAAYAMLLVVEDPRVREFIILYAFACLIAVLANMLPFIKLDGYLALVAITDTPHLRAHAVSATRRALARSLFGVELEPGKPRESSRMIAFGALCVLFPLGMFMWAAIRLQPTFLGIGPWMAAVYALLVLAFAVATMRRIVKFVVLCIRRGVCARQTAIASGFTIALAVLALLFPVPATVHLGFVAADDKVLLVATSESALTSLNPGESVRLLSNGIALQPEIGRASVPEEPESAARVDVPASALAPVVVPGATGEAWGVLLQKVEAQGTLPEAGAAEIGFDRSVPAGVFLLEVLVHRPLRSIVGGEVF